MTTFRRDIQIAMLTMVAVVLFAGAALCPASAQTRYESVFNGHRIIYPGIQHPRGPVALTRITFSSTRTNRLPNLPAGAETPGSVACVYKLVSWTERLPDRHQHNRTQRWHRRDCHRRRRLLPDRAVRPGRLRLLLRYSGYDHYAGLARPDTPTRFTGDWEVEEALDIEWSHAMAPQAKLFLVVSALCTQPAMRRPIRPGKRCSSPEIWWLRTAGAW